MRVIAGTYRSRLIEAPRGTATRPTSDRLRETLFNILQPRIEGSRFVDLYAGTGAVGIEALSRGASQVWFAENADLALAALRENIKVLKIGRNHAIEDRGTGAMLQRLAKLPAPVDLVYLDPPYEAEAEYEATLSFLGSNRGRQTLTSGALVIVEHASKGKFKLAARYGALEHFRLLKQGDAALSFYRLPIAEVTEPKLETPHPDADLSADQP
ncbi:MAG: methyltransferase [Acidobacteriaceae bacterium]|nr:methyltransferase [Acidobacteriaceae bacterium]